MKQTRFNATSFRNLLSIAFVVVVLIIAGLFYFGLQTIRDYAVEVTQTTRDATASGKQIEELEQLQQQLTQTRALVEKADQIYASSSTYQSQAIADLQRYAGAAGVSIVGTTFDPAVTAPDTRKVIITLAQPTSHARLVRFLQLVETSMPKMQVAELTVSRPDSPNGDAVNVEPIIINISVR